MNDYKSAVAIVTVTDTEFNAAKLFYDWEKKIFPGDEQEYYESSFERNKEKHKIILAKQNEMGMVACSVLSMKLIERYRPKYLIMVGIAAGIQIDGAEDFEYGDVICANHIWNYSNGKYVPAEEADIIFGNIGFKSRPLSIKTNEELLSYVEQANNSIENENHLIIGPMASGNSVIANSEYVKKAVTGIFQNTTSLDMESYAIAYAAKNATEPRPMALVLKSICDFADSRKDDRYQRFAAYTSMQFAQLLFEKYLPLD